MRPINWLHISDLHLRPTDKWSQDVVLESMCRDIMKQRDGGISFDFVLVTGDIAFSGKAEEYAMAYDFFKELQSATGVPIHLMFCVAGNHDVDRTRQELCFRGAKNELSGQSQVDNLLAGGEDLDTLLTRQENFRQFQNSLFATQDRCLTQDGLGYVSRVSVDDIKLAIIGLNSAWLAEGGLDDHGKLLIGERQVINALRLLQNCGDTPHIVIGMAHHPLRLLQEFDQAPLYTLFEEGLDFYHCGHLHEPTASLAGPVGTGYLTIAAGAAFQSRGFHNSYSIVELDLQHRLRTVHVYRYYHLSRSFYESDARSYPIDVKPLATCSVSALATAIGVHWPSLEPLAFYLASILMGRKTDLPIPSQDSYAFGSIDVMQDQPESPLKSKTLHFVTFTNILTVLYDRISLSDILEKYGEPVKQYGEYLISICKPASELFARLREHNRDAQMLEGNEPHDSFSHTLNLFDELAEGHAWDILREQAERRLGIEDSGVAVAAKRYLALGLANSDERAERVRAVGFYRCLSQSENCVFTDIGNLASLLFQEEFIDEARDTVLEGIKRFPEKSLYYVNIGHQIVEATGDREFRIRLEALNEGKHD